MKITFTQAQANDLARWMLNPSGISIQFDFITESGQVTVEIPITAKILMDISAKAEISIFTEKDRRHAIQVRITEEEASYLKDLAQAEATTVPDFVRSRIFAVAPEEK